MLFAALSLRPGPISLPILLVHPVTARPVRHVSRPGGPHVSSGPRAVGLVASRVRLSEPGADWTARAPLRYAPTARVHGISPPLSRALRRSIRLRLADAAGPAAGRLTGLCAGKNLAGNGSLVPASTAAPARTSMTLFFF